ncbi:MAG: hypothetical protein GTN43_05540, partial [Candidatus Aenigmarchaeota archaeon]|nr:hypothetical protein [Candidatus Aenigmarchaeota archaeon]
MSEMPDEGLEEYVRDQLAKGEKVEKIRKNLLNKGYPAEKVDKAINFATAREPGSSPVLETLHQRRTRRAQERAKEEDLVPKKISFFKKLSLVIRKPSIFFEIMKHEPGTAKAILYFVTFSIIILLLQI